MSSELVVTRTAFGIELRRGTFEVEVDGARVGSIEWHETKEFDLQPGHHTLQVRRGRYRSRAVSFEVNAGEVVTFRCHGAMVWPRWLASAFNPGLAISLARE